jgi:hypothetical protein
VFCSLFHYLVHCEVIRNNFTCFHRVSLVHDHTCPSWKLLAIRILLMAWTCFSTHCKHLAVSARATCSLAGLDKEAGLLSPSFLAGDFLEVSNTLSSVSLVLLLLTKNHCPLPSVLPWQDSMLKVFFSSFE